MVLAGLIGTVIGTLPWYGIGRLINEERIEHWLERHGRWIGISPADLVRSRKWFSRYGTLLVFWGRLLPGIRTLISVPAGIELMPFVPFLLWTTAGSLIWTLLLTLAGFALGEGYSNVEVWIEPVSKVIKVGLVVAAVAVAVWLGLRIWRRRHTADCSPGGASATSRVRAATPMAQHPRRKTVWISTYRGRLTLVSSHRLTSMLTRKTKRP